MKSYNKIYKKFFDVNYHGFFGPKSESVKSKDKRVKYHQNKLLRDGYEWSEWWDLRGTISKFILVRLKSYRENLHGYPTCLKNIKEWEKILDKMIKAFDNVITEDSILDSNLIEKRYKETEEGLNLFAKYYLTLWD